MEATSKIFLIKNPQSICKRILKVKEFGVIIKLHVGQQLTKGAIDHLGSFPWSSGASIALYVSLT